jgi:hypothetical protein
VATPVAGATTTIRSPTAGVNALVLSPAVVFHVAVAACVTVAI